MGDKMVLYKLIEENSNEVKYEYYPEGKLDKKGILVFDKNTKNVKDIEYSEDDYIVIHTVEEQNRLRDSLNEARKERGAKLLTEEEWPTATEDMEYYLYASHTIDEISIRCHRLRKFPQEGRKIWY
jgi:hypothetical protein